jgi:hypothetical protein
MVRDHGLGATYRNTFLNDTVRTPHRWIGWFDVIGKVTCPSGHILPTVDTWSDADLICNHRGTDGRDDCGKRVYVAPMLRFRGKPILMACEVSAREMVELRALSAPDEILSLLFPAGAKAA